MCKKIEIIVPCYNEEKCVALFCEKIEEIFTELPNYQYNILFVDDGSKDNTLYEIKNLEQHYGREKVKYISFSRNFGKESAMYVGLSKSTGDYVVIMDADLQHPPQLLGEMIDALDKEDFDSCAARRVSRKGEPPIRSAFSRTFYKMFQKISGVEMVQGSTDFRMMKRAMVEAIVSMPETERFTKGIYSWVGFHTKWIEYENVERVAGETKWSFGGLLKYALNGFFAFATAPLRFIVYLGIVIVALSFCYGAVVFYGALKNPGARTGYASIIIIMLFLGGVIISILGLLGEYLARIYMEVKRRPIYIIRETNI